MRWSTRLSSTTLKPPSRIAHHLNDLLQVPCRAELRSWFYLVWMAGNTDLTEEVYEACVAEGKRAKLEPVYHVYARYNLFGTEDVRFYRIPDQILIDFGLDMRTEAYMDGGDE